MGLDDPTPAKQRFLKHLDESSKRSKKLTNLLTKETDRGCALVAAALLDERLLKLFRARMIERATVNKFDSIFEGHGPLATFAARTHLAYLLGFIANNVYHDLCVIRDIRNRFAHSPEDLDFSDKEIKANCEKLHHYMKLRVSDNPRAQFISAVATLDTVLEYLIFDSEHTTTPADGVEDLKEILGKQLDLYTAKAIGISPK